jgi:hypothetical protein
MTKESNICFRTSWELRESLQEIARDERRTLSGLVQAVLEDYIDQRNSPQAEERRHHRRKASSLPVHVSQSGDKGRSQLGIVKDDSLGGVRISLPEDSNVEVWRDGKEVHLDLLMELPNEKVPATIKCKTCRLEREDGKIEVGARITGYESADFDRLQRYLEGEDSEA